jgi:hypothetical protein
MVLDQGHQLSSIFAAFNRFSILIQQLVDLVARVFFLLRLIYHMEHFVQRFARLG